ncbi:MAG TPA: hypothetical protein VFE16_11015 [Candidatus Cybelea sp.]|nr:hypothetical protein [Candidatus Cybelea sp.]
MRRSLLVAAVLASFGLAACSNGGSVSIPNAQSLAPSLRSTAHLVVEGVPQAKCPTTRYIACLPIAKGHPAKYTICITSGGTCSSGSFPNQKWSSMITTLKKKVFKGITAAFKPNPGNPTKGTVTAKVKLKDSKGKVAYIQAVKACPTAGGKCLTNDVGLITK